MCDRCPDLTDDSKWSASHMWPVVKVAPADECDCFLCWDGPMYAVCVASSKPNHYYDPTTS